MQCEADRIEMIRDKTTKTTRVQESLKKNTHIGLDVLVLEVERVLPDIDADDGDVSEERVLVSGGHDLKTLVRGVVSLHRRQTLDKNDSKNARNCRFEIKQRQLTSQPHPDP